MKLLKNTKKIIISIIVTIIIYAIFLLMTDIEKITTKIFDFKSEFIPMILGLVILSWIINFFRWSIILKHINVHIPMSINFQIFLIGGALGITPGKIGELFKSQILKEKFSIPRTKTAPLFIVEKFLDFVGAMIIAVIGIWFVPEIGYIVLIGLSATLVVFKILTSKKLFYKLFDFFNRFKILKKYLESLDSSHETINGALYNKKVFFLLLLSCGYWIVIGMAAFFVLEAVGVSTISVINMISTYSSSLIIGAISFLPGGVGVAEGSLIGLLSIQGIDVSDAIIIVVLIRIFTLWFSTIIGLIALKTSNVL